MSLLKRFGRQLAAFWAIAATACVGPGGRTQAASPAMWKVADERHHHLSVRHDPFAAQGHQWRSPAFDKAAAGSDTLVVETVIDETNPAATIGELFKLAVSPGFRLAADRVPADKKAALRDGDRQVGHPGAGARQDGNLGGGIPAAGRTVQGPRPRSRLRRRIRAQEAVRRWRKADRPARDQCRAARLLRQAVGRGPAQIPRRRARRSPPG